MKLACESQYIKYEDMFFEASVFVHNILANLKCTLKRFYLFIMDESNERFTDGLEPPQRISQQFYTNCLFYVFEIICMIIHSQYDIIHNFHNSFIILLNNHYISLHLKTGLKFLTSGQTFVITPQGSAYNIYSI